jgi:ABC-type antimicrobial peptide transport system permease subunit
VVNFNLSDTISGSEARAFMTINGRVYEMFYVKKIEAKVIKNKSEGRVIGSRATQHKATGWSGTGTMTIYYVTSMFRQIMLDYIKKGIDAYFDVQVINDDEASPAGNQTVLLKRVNLDEVIMALMDADAEFLEEEIPFTFEDVDILDSFNELSY